MPADQAAWNSYTATITDSSDQTTNFTGGTLAKGLYTLHVTDAYGNTKDYHSISISPLYFSSLSYSSDELFLAVTLSPRSNFTFRPLT